MADLQCLICDYTVPAGKPEDQVLELLGVGSADAGYQLVEHMGEHSLADWVKAFKMADAYIEQLEAELEQARQSASELARAPVTTFPAPAQAWANNQAERARQDFVDLTPSEQARLNRAAQIRAVVQSADPDQTLIPHIPDAQRPEGMVGVKY